jgi:hypothetical protein
MSEKRMFAKQIVESDAFLDMPLSTQALYLHLGMAADDDGFINAPKRIQRSIGASDDDLKLLIAKNFIIPFETGVVVIKHWLINNYIRADRKKDTAYPEEMSQLTIKENGSYKLGSQDVIPSDTKESARQRAYRLSSLPYSFDYKIRQAFYGKQCPICGALMQRNVDEGIETNNRVPSIQHNKPISKGGLHELGNISVICKQCNITIKDNETDSLNADEVVSEWDRIVQASDRQVTGKCPSDGSIDKNRLDKNRLNNSSSRGGKVNLLNKLTPEETENLFATYEDADYLIDEVEADINLKMKGAEIDNFYRYIIGYATKRGWLTI